MREPAVSVNNLTKAFSGRTVVDSLSFQVEKGQVFALLGHKGAGKSTTIDLILGLKAPEGGSARLLGMDAASHRKQVFERVGVQLQNTQYQSNITADEVCMEYASLYAAPADYPRLLERFGLGPHRRNAGRHSRCPVAARIQDSFFRATPHNSARAGGEGFFLSRTFGKQRATPHKCVCGSQRIFCTGSTVSKMGNTYSIPSFLKL